MRLRNPSEFSDTPKEKWAVLRQEMFRRWLGASPKTLIRSAKLIPRSVDDRRGKRDANVLGRTKGPCRAIRRCQLSFGRLIAHMVCSSIERHLQTLDQLLVVDEFVQRLIHAQ